jgi:hypothetical protein
MGIEEIAKENTIEFPRPIGREGAENLLCYIAKELPANISSKIEYYKTFFYDQEKDGVLEDKGTLTVIANIHDLRENGGFDSFQSKSCGGDTSYISAIASQMVPDWELSDYRPEIRKLWKDVRQIVDEYFRKKEKD